MARNDIQFVELHGIRELSRELVFEICGVHVTDVNIVVLNIYRSPDGDFDVFLELVEQLLEMFKEPQRVMISGDFNVWFGATDRRAELLQGTFETFGYRRLLNVPTRGMNCIDNIFLNFTDSSIKINTDYRFSDHYSIIFECMLHRGRKVNNNIVKIRPITTKGKMAFFNYVQEIDWGFVSDSVLVAERKMDHFMELLTYGFNAAFPEKSKRGQIGKSSSAWFTPQLKAMRDHLSLLNDMCAESNTDELKSHRKMFNKSYNKAIKEAKIQNNNQIIKNSGFEKKKMWQVVNDLRGGKKSNSTSIKFDPDNMNDFFINVPKTILKSLTNGNIEESGLDVLLNRIDNGVMSEFVFEPVSYIEIRDIITSIKSTTSRDYFGLTVEVVKYIKDLIVVPLTNLINCCIKEGVFPAVLKIALVVPIYKKGDPDMIQNYTPISLLPVISKIFEKALKSRITDYFEINKLFTSSQFGFRAGMGTREAVLRFVEDVVQCFEDGEYLSATFCDLSKAFDCVQHELLIDKLLRYRFHASSLAMIASYLQNRYQVVKCNNFLSSKKPVSVGVPQGSILGPILFLIYLNDFANNITTASVLHYADDTTLVSKSKFLERSAELSSVALSEAECWFRSNSLGLNTEKTLKTVFTLRHVADDVAGDPVKFLGIYLDSGLSWDHQIASVCRRLCSNIYALRVMSGNVSSDILRMAYYAFCQPIITYNILVWGNAGGWHTVFRLQRRAVRLIDGLNYRDDCRQSYIKLNILTFPSIFILECVTYVRSNLGRFSSHGDIHKYSTRQKNNLIPEFCRLSKSQKSVWYNSLQFYNRLPISIRQLPTKTFKNCVKRFLMKNAFYSFDEYMSSPICEGDLL